MNYQDKTKEELINELLDLQQKHNSFRALHKKEINERKLAEEALKESEARYHLIADYSHDWEVYRDNNRNLIYSSPAFERLTGYKNEDYLSGRITMEDFIHPEDYDYAISRYKNIKKGELISDIDYRIITKDGAVKYVGIAIQSVKTGENQFAGFRTSIKDITKIKQAEDILKERKNKLKELNFTKDKFFSILAHDLINPFNTILGFSRLLSDNVREYNTDEIETQAKYIYQTSKQTYELLEDLLTWAGTQSGKMPFKPKKLQFTNICQDITEALKPYANSKNITINNLASDEIYIFADGNMLKTILRNLISNAIKFTNKGGEIYISAETNRLHATISISDNGIGIDNKILGKLFDISQKHTTTGTDNEKGTGLGLILCKEFTEKQGGKISIISEKGKGSEVKFTIPLFID